MKNNKGFTLIELVLFIVVAGIIFGIFLNLVQKEQLSKIQSIITQVNNYNLSTHLFLQKYGELPGDISRTEVLELSRYNTDGNENGILEDGANHLNDNNSALQASGEIVNFWLHLSNSDFIDQNFDGKLEEKASVGFTFPQLLANKEVGIIAFGVNNSNYYQIGFSHTHLNIIEMTDLALEPKVAFGIDKKLDDGIQDKGTIMAVTGNHIKEKIEDINQKCVDFDSYNLRYKGMSCQLRIKFPESNESR